MQAQAALLMCRHQDQRMLTEWGQAGHEGVSHRCLIPQLASGSHLPSLCRMSSSTVTNRETSDKLMDIFAESCMSAKARNTTNLLTS